jgi:hypothetical protein
VAAADPPPYRTFAGILLVLALTITALYWFGRSF